MNGVCPCCGYCPTCGRRNTQPYIGTPIQPLPGPVWIGPQIVPTLQTGNISTPTLPNVQVWQLNPTRQ